MLGAQELSASRAKGEHLADNVKACRMRLRSADAWCASPSVQPRPLNEHRRANKRMCKRANTTLQMIGCRNSNRGGKSVRGCG
eukprot:819965-Rhodomonas_salina.1